MGSVGVAAPAYLDVVGIAHAMPDGTSLVSN